MNTTTAAAKAGVTVATIRTWCRRGVVTATKTAGRWDIDTTSLNRRIEIGARKMPKPAALTIENLTAIGGREWKSSDGSKHRIYFNNWPAFAGLETSHYKSGNVASAAFGGRAIANGRVAGIASAIDTIWFDVADGRFRGYWARDAREFPIRYYNGDRDHVDLVGLTIAGIRDAVADL